MISQYFGMYIVVPTLESSQCDFHPSLALPSRKHHLQAVDSAVREESAIIISFGMSFAELVVLAVATLGCTIGLKDSSNPQS
jgi:hypothetical protein